MQQEILIPNIMEKISKERDCKEAYTDFLDCIADQFDPTRYDNNEKYYLEKLYKVTYGHACKEKCDAMHKCSEKAMFDEELYYEAK
jgi:hypothetical protein